MSFGSIKTVTSRSERRTFGLGRLMVTGYTLDVDIDQEVDALLELFLNSRLESSVVVSKNPSVFVELTFLHKPFELLLGEEIVVLAMAFSFSWGPRCGSDDTLDARGKFAHQPLAEGRLTTSGRTGDDEQQIPALTHFVNSQKRLHRGGGRRE